MLKVKIISVQNIGHTNILPNKYNITYDIILNVCHIGKFYQHDPVTSPSYQLALVVSLKAVSYKILILYFKHI